MNQKSCGLPVVLVLARADNGVIGRGGGLPWRIKSDMAHFKRMTMGNPVIMGRKTWATLRGPLPGRVNIVVSRQPGLVADGANVVPNFEYALKYARKIASANATALCVIGGGEIYRMALPLARRIELTEVHMDAEGDVTMDGFPEAHWHEAARARHTAKDGEACDYSFVTLTRKIGVNHT